MPNGPCKLCGVQADLQLSHILPAFVFRWLRESSGNGFLRQSKEPNQRVQDGEKRFWLCSGCEGLLGRSETLFATKVFHPYLENSGQRFRYSSWLMHFCTSLSWRIVKLALDEDHFGGWHKDAVQRVVEAERAWREVLLGNRPHPGPFQQHLLPLDRIESASGQFTKNINRYLMRAVQMDICRGSESIFTYAKLGRFIVLGFVHEPKPEQWRGAKVNANEGFVEPRKYVLPRAFGEYLNSNASKVSDALDSISDKQKIKIDEAFRKNVDRYVGSDAFNAMAADHAMFGDDALSKRR